MHGKKTRTKERLTYGPADKTPEEIAKLVEQYPGYYLPPPSSKEYALSDAVQALKLAMQLVAKQAERLREYERGLAAYNRLLNGPLEDAVKLLTPKIFGRLEALLEEYKRHNKE